MDALTLVALAITIVGLIFTLIGTGQLLFGIRHDDPKYSSLAMPREMEIVPSLIYAQRRPLWLALIGGSVQVVGGVLAIVAAF
jgi:hypothetical protein